MDLERIDTPDQERLRARLIEYRGDLNSLIMSVDQLRMQADQLNDSLEVELNRVQRLLDRL